jgi:hypothetical protein
MTKQIKTVVYGEGGFDDSKPENNVVEIVYYTTEELAEIAEAEAKAAAKAALLAQLGITEEQAKLLLS